MYCKLIKQYYDIFSFKYEETENFVKIWILWFKNSFENFHNKEKKYNLQKKQRNICSNLVASTFSTGFLHWFQWPYHVIQCCITNGKRFLVND